MPTDLIKKLKAAAGGSRDLDYQIHCASGWRDCDQAGWIHEDGREASQGWPHYTTSFDAAVALLPEGWEFKGDLVDTRWRYFVEGWNGKFAPDCREVLVSAKSGPIAICIAAFEAREADAH